eukprot:Skav235442  [mRNA]  locus=scaffold2206:44197:52166:- [translate_table: standard]
MGKTSQRSSGLLQLAAVASVLYASHWAFVGSSTTPRSTPRTLRRGGGESVPTGLVWPSPEAEEKLREVDGIKLYPTHAWKDEMVPILDSSAKLEVRIEYVRKAKEIYIFDN